MKKLGRRTALKNGDMLGVIALSAACEKERFERGVNCLTAMGFSVRVALDPCINYGRDTHLFSSDSAEARAAALMELFADGQVAAIIAARGAYGALEVLPHLDFKLIAEAPKPVVGFSDVTAILVALYQQSSLGVVHGPSIESAFSKAHADEGARLSSAAIVSYLKGEVINPLQSLTLKHMCGGLQTEGPLIGGNLSVLASLLGTPWEPNLDGHILFLEEVGEKPYRIHRLLMQLKLSGKLKRLAGVLLGDFLDCRYEHGPQLSDVIHDVFDGLKYPVFAGLAAGHAGVNLPVPLGLRAVIKDAKIELNSSVVLN